MEIILFDQLRKAKLLGKRPEECVEEIRSNSSKNVSSVGMFSPQQKENRSVQPSQNEPLEKSAIVALVNTMPNKGLDRRSRCC